MFKTPVLSDTKLGFLDGLTAAANLPQPFYGINEEYCPFVD